MNYEPKITKQMEAVNENLTVDICGEADCGISVVVEKEHKASGRQTRCVSCLMRTKIRTAMNK